MVILVPLFKKRGGHTKTHKDNAHVYGPVFQVESEFGIFREFRRHLQGAGAPRHQEPHDNQHKRTYPQF